LTIGIKAPWGAGKTSLMKHVQYLLDGTAAVTEENEAARRTRSLEVSVTLRQVIATLAELGQTNPRAEPTPSAGQDVTQERDRQRWQRLRQMFPLHHQSGHRANVTAGP
jgi:hypothetical protein